MRTWINTARRIYSVRTVAVLIVLQAFLCSAAFSQTNDSLSVSTDSTQASTDSLTTTSGGIDSAVVYSANDSIVFTFKNKQMKIFGKGDVRFKDLSLKSERIDVNWNTNELESYGVLDTAKAQKTDSLKERYTGTPVMIEGA
ncbi:MAG: hypothetical protein WCW40_11080, partial [Bacteroidota bacterium]